MSGLPFVRSLQVYGQLLASSEGIALGKTEDDARSDTSRGLAHDVGFEVDVVGFVEDAVDGHIEGVAGGGGVARRKGEVDS